MGPDNYIFSDYYCAFKKELFPGIIITFTIETARIDTRENTEELFYEVIEYFRLYTGIHKNNLPAQHDYTLYPNPATNTLFLKNNSANQTDIKFQLYDINGREVNNYSTSNMGKGNMLINIVNLPNGLYIYKIISVSGNETGKLLKH
jgi:hypothetical protein